MNALLKNLVLMLVSLTVMFGLCEGLTRLLYKESTHLMPRYHTAAKYGEITLRQIRPNMEFTHTTVDGTWEFKTNAQGFRNDHDFSYAKDVDTIRVVAIGDSTTQGHESHQNYTYSATIEKFLKSRNINAEVLNTGVSGFSTAEALLLLREELVKYHPDYVVLGFFANDYEDNLKSGLFKLDESGGLKLQKTEHIPGVAIQDFIYAIPGVQWLGENSYFYSKLFNESWGFFKARLASNARETVASEIAIATKTEYSNYEVDLTAALIRQISQVSHDAGAELIIVDIPQARPNDRFSASIIGELMPVAKQSADFLVSADVLAPYEGLAQLHVPHGNRHVTEFTHTLLGIEVADYIWKRVRANKPARGNPIEEDQSY